MIISFDVPGAPVGKGRPRVSTRGGKFASMYTPEKTASYESLVAYAAAQVMAGKAVFDCPVAVQLDIRLPIPQSWSKKKQEAAKAGEVHPTKKPDIDNVEKAIFDAMNGIVWIDDVQVCQVSKQKRYGQTPGVRVIVESMP